MVNIGRVATAIVVVLGMLWIPIMQKIGGGVLYQYLQSVQAYIAPPITAVFLFGILWKRINAQGAIATLFFGLVVGTFRIIAELNTTPTDTGLFADFANINFAHMAIFMFIACSIVCVVVSLLTPAPSKAQLVGLTFGTLTPEQKASAKDSYNKWDIIASVFLVIVVIGIFILFHWVRI